MKINRCLKIHRWVWIATGLIILIIIAFAIGIWGKRQKFPPEPLCTNFEDNLRRLDCHPDRPVREQSCLERGCCYRPASDSDVTDNDLITSPYLGVPTCYFPENYKGYELDGNKTKAQDSDIYAEFKRVESSGFLNDLQKISLYVSFIDNEGLYITIKELKKDRFRPDVPIVVKQKTQRNELYSVTLSDDGELEVLRKSTNQAVFKTDISRLIFSDQFIQISTTLPSHYVYGLGEHKEGILKSTNWTRYTLFNQGDLPVPHRNLYGSHPFYLVMEPGGESSGVFLLNSNAMDYVLQPSPALTIRTIGGELEFYIFLGPTPEKVVSQYTMLFGKPNFPPRWSLGFHLCRYGYFSLNTMKETLQRNLDAEIPIDVLWNDIDYMDRYLDFTYNPINFSGLPQFVDELHQQGRHYIAMISPGLSNSEKAGTYSPYDEAKKLDLFIKDTDGNDIQGKVWNTELTVFPDFSNPKTEDFWVKHFEEFHKKLDFDGVWIDMNEPFNFMNASDQGCPSSPFDDPPYLPGRPYPLKTFTLCMSARHFQTEHYNEHNLLAYREAKATHMAMSKITKKRPFIISRATFAGQGIYSGHWSGDITSDWNDLRYTIPAMLSFSLYGMPMTGSDICGFRLNTTEELCTRWHSLGAFYPFSRNHNDYDTLEQDPAIMGEQVLTAAKNALKIRYYLLPYLYTLFYRNHIYGETVARPLFFEFPFDKNTYVIEDEFLWGPGFLIMPALSEGVTTISPYVPKGIWYELEGKQYVSEGQHIELSAPLTKINVFLRGGYIFPAQESGKTTTESAQNPFDILVALNETNKAKGQLFWDDGESIDSIESGNYMLLDMQVEQNILKISTTHKGFTEEMNIKNIKVYGLKKKPITVTVNDKSTSFLYDDTVSLLTIQAFIEYNIEDDLKVAWN